MTSSRTDWIDGDARNNKGSVTFAWVTECLLVTQFCADPKVRTRSQILFTPEQAQALTEFLKEEQER